VFRLAPVRWREARAKRFLEAASLWLGVPVVVAAVGGGRMLPEGGKLADDEVELAAARGARG
jgi:hypothetical protein